MDDRGIYLQDPQRPAVEEERLFRTGDFERSFQKNEVRNPSDVDQVVQLIRPGRALDRQGLGGHVELGLIPEYRLLEIFHLPSFRRDQYAMKCSGARLSFQAVATLMRINLFRRRFVVPSSILLQQIPRHLNSDFGSFSERNQRPAKFPKEGRPGFIDVE